MKPVAWVRLRSRAGPGVVPTATARRGVARTRSAGRTVTPAAQKPAGTKNARATLTGTVATAAGTRPSRRTVAARRGAGGRCRASGANTGNTNAEPRTGPTSIAKSTGSSAN